VIDHGITARIIKQLLSFRLKTLVAGLVITRALLAIIPLVAMLLILERFWRVDLTSGAVKG
jgi:ABC-type maltose transport system permease subunit